MEHRTITPPQPKLAFSLVELSIVLVILGLLVGGVLSGQSLIHAAELRNVTKEYNQYLTATLTFRDKYFALPGDMPNATQFWGRSRVSGDCVTNSGAAVATPGTCDGDGDGLIELPTAAWNPDVSGENFQFWRHLQLAGLLEGSATGFSPPLGGGTRFQAPYTQPSRSGSSTYWDIFSDFTWVGAANYPSGAAGTNTFILEGPGHYNGSLLQSEMWSIDTKIDDGKPSTGAIVTKTQGWGGSGACVSGVVASGGYYWTDSANEQVWPTICQFVAPHAF